MGDSFEASKKRSDEIRADLSVNPGKYCMLTGDRPTGRLHLGHYFGTIRERVALQNLGVTSRVIIADYQVITDRDTTANIQDNVYNMVIDYLACGIDPEKTIIFTHSQVPALNQLMLPFLSLCTEAELERNPTVKSEQEASGHALTGLLLTYPVHQACDILFCKGNIVPVGKDQLPHIEQTRQIARRFNERYGHVFPEPEGLLTMPCSSPASTVARCRRAMATPSAWRPLPRRRRSSLRSPRPTPSASSPSIPTIAPACRPLSPRPRCAPAAVSRRSPRRSATAVRAS